MGRIVYQRDQYYVQEVFSSQKKGYILFNMKKEFQDGHTHLNNLKTAKYLIMLIQKQRLPFDINTYLLESIIRVSENGSYQEKAKDLLKVREKKDTKKYINVRKKNVYC